MAGVVKGLDLVVVQCTCMCIVAVLSCQRRSVQGTGGSRTTTGNLGLAEIIKLHLWIQELYNWTIQE